VAVVLACSSAFLFGAMTVVIRLALQRGADAEGGTLATLGVALVLVALLAAGDGVASGRLPAAGVSAFALAGLLAPGASQLSFTMAVRDVGASRTGVVVGMAPLASYTFAVVLLGEPLSLPRAVGALLIVLGGVALLSERRRPAHLRALGLAFAGLSAVLIATRDNLLRWLSVSTSVTPLDAAALALVAGTTLVGVYVVHRRGRDTLAATRSALPAFAPAGVLFGLSYASLFEAYYRGRVTLVSPLVATESLWAVLLASMALRHTDVVGRRLALGAALVVAGGVVIGATG
jgi:uncharacterized membrane protein